MTNFLHRSSIYNYLRIIFRRHLSPLSHNSPQNGPITSQTKFPLLFDPLTPLQDSNSPNHNPPHLNRQSSTPHYYIPPQQQQPSVCFMIFVFKVQKNMLMKPPPILDDIISQDSENYTAKSKDKANKARLGKKENTIRFGANPQPADKPREYDNQSVHSTGSRKSKDKRAKETTLNRPKIMAESSHHREEDAHSVHSNGSKHSHKSTKKENTIMSRPKMEAAITRNRGEERPTEKELKFMSFKQAIVEPEESIIRVLEPSVESPRPINYRDDRLAGKPNKVETKAEVREPKYAPFKQLENNYSDEDIPVYRLEESNLNQKQNQVVLGARRFDNPTESRQINTIEQSQTIFDESRMNETKSRRRRDIFGKPKEIDNSSKVSNNIEQSISASGIDDSRRKSKSRLREIFNNSRQKKSIEESVPNPSHLSSVGNLPEFSRELTSVKPVVGSKDRMVQLQRKVLDDDNDKFGEESVKSGLELSSSNNHGNAYDKDRDSLIFQFEPDKKKGMSVASKTLKAEPAKEQAMINLKGGNLNSVRNDNQKQDELMKIGNNNLVSKELEGVKKILKENEEYLMKSGIMDLSASYRPKVGNNSTSSDYLFKFEEEELIQPYKLDLSPKGDKPWHEIVPKYQNEKVNIKKVERNEKPMNKQAEEKQKEMSKKRQQEERQIAKKKELEKEKERKEAERQRERKEAQKERQRREAEKERERRQSQRKEIEKIEKEKRQKQYELKQKEEELRRIREETERQRQLAQKQRQRQLEREREEAERIKRQNRIKQQDNKIKLSNVPSTYSKDSDNESQRSNKSSKKPRGKKQSSLPRDKNQRIHIKSLSPRAEQSFYQSSVQEREEQSKIPTQSVAPQQKVEKKPKLLSFSDEENEEKPKSKTDMNFYEFTNSQKSIKPPSSRPPLSRKSNTSTSKSKEKRPKQSTLGNNINKRPEKTGNFKKAEPTQPAKKMTLMERALMKHNEESSNGSYSQDSFRSREEIQSQNSRDSVSSKNSKKSLKKESTIKISKEALLLQSKPPIKKKPSFDSSQEEDVYEKKEENKFKQPLVKERTVVSKNCTFIDERGRLVQQDLIIKGGEVYGRSNLVDSNVQALQRMKRSREGRRSRSKSRESRGKLSRQTSNNISESDSYYDNNSNFTNSYYDNSNYRNTQNNGLALREFIKPVEQVPNYTKRQTNEPKYSNQRNYERSNVYERPVEEKPLTLNEVFGRTKNQPENTSNMTQSRSRKSLSRTEKSFNRR